MGQTVGIAIPYAIFAIIVPADPKAGDVTSVPAYRYTTIATIQYMDMSEIWRRAKALGKSFGFFISSRNPKNAAWPADNEISDVLCQIVSYDLPYAKTMFVTERNASWNVRPSFGHRL